MQINIDLEALDKVLETCLEQAVQKLKPAYESESLCRMAVMLEIQDNVSAYARSVFSKMMFDFRNKHPAVRRRSLTPLRRS